MLNLLSTDTEASALTLQLYDIVKSSMAMYSDPQVQQNVIISRVPEIRTKLDEIITNHCGLAVQ